MNEQIRLCKCSEGTGACTCKPKNLMEDIEAFLRELTESKKQLERKYRLITGCKTYGMIELDLENLCNHPECNTCRSFEKAFREEVQKWRKKQTMINLNKLR